ncbi:Gag Polyprotein [Phytophthora cinnamomi]|uniref:Gag Polyprotein n=1 Tax=Phytophthora cinnamomi TaxID=4785 RepID=UPI003559945F|nr:Gag Polyprotein [Phytophthora cinnamomi]
MGYMRFVVEANEEEQSSSSSSSESEYFIGIAMKGSQHGTSGDWMLDSGTTSHVCSERELFTRLKKSKASFKMWDGGITHGNLCGSVVINAVDTNAR